MRIVFLSHTTMGGPFVVGSHHIAQELAKAGHDVFHVGAPISIPHFVAMLFSPFIRVRVLRWIKGGACVGLIPDFVPFALIPWQLARFSRTGRSLFSRSLLKSPISALKSLDIANADVVFVDEPRFAGLVNGISGPRLVYRATDLYALMRRDPTIVEMERDLCLVVHEIVATSEPIANHLRNLSKRDVTVIQNGVDFEHFAGVHGDGKGSNPRTVLPGSRQDRAIYVGAFDERFGLDALKQAANALPERHFVLAGPGSETAAKATSLPNVLGLGPIAYSQLPDLLSRCAVGLLPMSSSESNAGRSPMKLHEYFASGLMVAATFSDVLSGYPPEVLRLAVGNAQFPRAVADAFLLSSDPSHTARARAIASKESWTDKSSGLLALAFGSRVAHDQSTGKSAVLAKSDVHFSH